MKITNLFTGEKVKCNIEKANRAEVFACKSNYGFDWLKEFRQFEVYKLVTEENPEIVQALFSLKASEGFIELSTLERANFRIMKIYEGITPLVFSFACKMSFDLGFEGFVTFQSKSALVKYYSEVAGAEQIGSSQKMIIQSHVARKLVDLYYE